MKILHIISQKPSDTGSGLYIRNLIKELKKRGHKQSILCGVENLNESELGIDEVKSYPVIFNTKKLPFNIVGMSDVMPYNSTRYRDLDKDMLYKFKCEFENTIVQAINEFKPDVILCNHLYLVTALTVDLAKKIKVYGICHGTDLRQLKSHDLEKKFIINNLKKLSGVFALHNNQKEDLIKNFNIDKKKVIVSGIGYDDSIFYNENLKKSKKINIVYTGKLCYSKGVRCLINAYSSLELNKNEVCLNIIGDGCNEEKKHIIKLAEKSQLTINFLGRLTQHQLSHVYNKSHIFVLPSFYEGLPLVLVEALSSGMYVISSELNGVKNWFGDNINNSGRIEYVELPKMKSLDEPCESGIEEYEDRLKKSIIKTISKVKNSKDYNEVDTQELTWSGLSKVIEKNIDL